MAGRQIFPTLIGNERIRALFRNELDGIRQAHRRPPDLLGDAL